MPMNVALTGRSTITPKRVPIPSAAPAPTPAPAPRSNAKLASALSGGVPTGARARFGSVGNFVDNAVRDTGEFIDRNTDDYTSQTSPQPTPAPNPWQYSGGKDLLAGPPPAPEVGTLPAGGPT